MTNPIRAYQNVNGTSILIREQWFDDDKQPHRSDGPAYLVWTVVNGQPVLTKEGWYIHGKYHREDGPAYQDWRIVNDRPVMVHSLWYNHGQRTDLGR